MTKTGNCVCLATLPRLCHLTPSLKTLLSSLVGAMMRHIHNVLNTSNSTMSKLKTYIIIIVLNKAAYDSFFLLFFNTGVKAISDYDRNNAYDSEHGQNYQYDRHVQHIQPRQYNMINPT